MSIHPTAIVSRSAELGRDVEVGAYSFIGPHVRVGDGTRIHHHATLDGHTTLGSECEVFPQAVLGMAPQDIKYHGERTTLEIGDRNTFREMVTAHPGTENGGGITRIGHDNLFLIGIHIAHDCEIGDGCIFANAVQLAGHVRVENNVNIGGNTAVHHFVSIGKHAFVGGMTRITADVPPFMIVVAARGTRSEVRMVNGVGLQRSGFSNEDIGELKRVFMKLFSRRARSSGTGIRERVQAELDAAGKNPHVTYLCEFLMRSFTQGRHGRYLESLRNDPVYRNTWKPQRGFQLTVNVVGRGTVRQVVCGNKNESHESRELTALAEPGWGFAEWNGGLRGSANPVSVLLDRDQTVTATFVQKA